ncbi:MAG TPA: c-type cytochrome [Denitromonas sp.]|uniref:c-type cytochrome n=1 Tax=Denitromonas sp. TaxID=2734609 RepID=UPI001D31BA83|nr:c-type cytochrome [Rhodocyclaceae bacterium]MCP5220206.1 c-type cytochrome [Zoogloeaceae bacterium]HPR07949.1 c-type cytochrome [Denitromonas sp.]HQU87917.1 c-type cytochrome [Denitromonas sp.]HQV14003.1 c-type cytochrome [Denitromonas sp.]
MRTKVLLVVALALGFIQPASASYEVVKKARCVSCHALDKKMVGPAFRDIAAKYAGQADGQAALFAKVREGGSGVWGQIPMTPNDEAKISDDNLNAAIAWILAGAEK